MSYPVPKRPWTIVARREVMAKLTDRAFWIATIAPIVMMILGFGASFLFSVPGSGIVVGVADDEAAAVVTQASDGDMFTIERMPAAEFEQAILADDIAFAVSHDADQWTIVSKDARTQFSPVMAAIHDYVLAKNAQAVGVSAEAILANTEAEVKFIGAEKPEESILHLVTGLVFSVLFFFSATLYGLQIAQSVVEEKESRIVEILAATMPTRQLLLGKVVGNTLMAFGQLVLLVAVAVAIMSQTNFGYLLPAIAPSLGWFVVFFLFGFTTLSCLYAATGAMATRVQDVQSTSMPLFFILFGVYIAGFMATGALAKVLAFVPLLSSVLMPQLVLRGEATWWQAAIALLLTIVAMVLALWLAERVYRQGIMKTSGILRYKEIFSRNG
ncbi:MAG: hypothetical protein CSA64_04160 [Arachnia propionica]|nr:MAG: hypothetical protein CSA64_04160 [Arachnia propionica]